MPAESPNTVSIKRSTKNDTPGNPSFGEISITKVNDQMVYAPGVVKSYGQGSDTQRPAGGTEDGKEAAVPDRNESNEANSTATGMASLFKASRGH
ncbi:uncharacterized protein FTJAE_9073 [Fusarium tjaetaba]|uniref:Uncharacterized protein n=1 Tax=Fusarium tjaetaba TaxID=1567544 RepID=A0A8H5R2K2_9HYPO|nr:uncharacterized protein FTJAE_9073 [Fusarium tjaetaba]KAF5627805.1 hypothetical protein FTJAE_9073 [Fusarium tjaetaba]